MVDTVYMHVAQCSPVCVCVCVWERESVCVCMCVSEWVRERERERERERTFCSWKGARKLMNTQCTNTLTRHVHGYGYIILYNICSILSSEYVFWISVPHACNGKSNAGFLYVQEALGSIPSDCPGIFLFHLAYTNTDAMKGLWCSWLLSTQTWVNVKAPSILGYKPWSTKCKS